MPTWALAGGSAAGLRALSVVMEVFLLFMGIDKLSFHFASDVLFHYSYLTNGYGLPVLGSLMALAIGGARLPPTISK